ncbi:sensor histidine kinase [Saccharothrix violaceirubra]|uniref:Signal transduction histidine kinase n=1 Tax=Saccharothrix violaceirubra TaxID=413306 RepID=A0A7W7WXE3_9PSEU|nr:histidine kinase [Saccharothrix violaceirubra]MBB4967354.1 signal transduction histidine kinase [Saccharothrix violaceirubra]
MAHLPPAFGSLRRSAARAAVVVACALAVAEVIRLLLTDLSPHRVAMAAAVVPATALQLHRFTPSSAKPRFAAFGVLVVLVFAPVLSAREPWIALPGFVAAAALGVFAVVPGLVIATATVVASGATHLGGGPNAVVSGVVATTLAALVLYGPTWLATAADPDSARSAVAAERRRVARDLHDLLGSGLSAITVQGELANRLLPEDPLRAKECVTEVVDIARHALGDVRSLALEFRTPSVPEVFASARALLTAAQVAVRLDVDDREVPEPAATVVAKLVREGVTNVVRHSRATRCEIALRRDGRGLELDIVNDGAPACAGMPGSGVRNMTERVREIGGVLTVERLDGDLFRLRARVPLGASGGLTG